VYLVDFTRIIRNYCVSFNFLATFLVSVFDITRSGSINALNSLSC